MFLCYWDRTATRLIEGVRKGINDCTLCLCSGARIDEDRRVCKMSTGTDDCLEEEN